MKRTNEGLVGLLTALMVAGCTADVSKDTSILQHDLAGDSTPWNSTQFDVADDKFTFAIHSDLTGGERDGIYEVAIAQLNMLRPEFIISVGDLIEGSSDRAEIDTQWDSFDERAGRSKAPVFYVGGNHDLTGRQLQQTWDERYGRRYYHFVYKNVLFLVLDTEDNTPERTREIEEARNHALKVADEEGWEAFAETEYSIMPENAAGNISAEQSRYFTDVIAANHDARWTFLLMHKAPWLREDLTAFADIEDALTDRPYTVFHGHVHSYQHQQRRSRDYIRLATTGGVQLPQYGRSMDHVTLVTVDNEGVDIANLLMEGILDKTGRIPLNGNELCFESTRCPQTE